VGTGACPCPRAASAGLEVVIERSHSGLSTYILHVVVLGGVFAKIIITVVVVVLAPPLPCAELLVIIAVVLMGCQYKYTAKGNLGLNESGKKCAWGSLINNPTAKSSTQAVNPTDPEPIRESVSAQIPLGFVQVTGDWWPR
jgi:hypothetical protein